MGFIDTAKKAINYLRKTEVSPSSEPSELDSSTKIVLNYESQLLKKAYDILKRAKDTRKYYPELVYTKAQLLLAATDDSERDAKLLLYARNKQELEKAKNVINTDLSHVVKIYYELLKYLPKKEQDEMQKFEREQAEKHHLPIQMIRNISIVGLLVGSFWFFRSFLKQSSATTGYISLGSFNSTYLVATAIGIVLLALFVFFFFVKRKK